MNCGPYKEDYSQLAEKMGISYRAIDAVADIVVADMTLLEYIELN